MTDFFARQERARKRTGLLLVYFGLALAFTALTVYLVIMLVFFKGGRAGLESLWHPQVFLWSVVGTVLVIAGGSLFRILELTSGGGAVARSLGGRLVSAQTRDPLERRLMNVVEEMSLASGVPMPEVYVLDEEEGINAFAAGNNTSDAAIGVTRGCLKWLKRDELQGVIAHEFSHILNGDMRLNLRLIGLIAGILTLTILGYVLMRVRGRGKGAGQVMLLGLALLIIGALGAFFARLIQAAISRQREYLADAAAVQFTRLPDGLAGALKKIGGLASGSRMSAPRAAESAHLFFGNGLSAAWTNLLATHPPLAERILAIEPRFDGRFPATVTPAIPDEKPARRVAPPAAKPGVMPPPVPDLAKGLPPIIPADRVLAAAGAPTLLHLEFAADLRSALPEEIASAMREPFGATALVYGLLLNGEADVQAGQIKALETTISPAMARETLRLRPALQRVPVTGRLPLVDLLLPALRELSPEQFAAFERAVGRLIEADQQIDLFEFALQKLLRRHLEPHFRGAGKKAVNYYAIKAIANETGLLLSALAHVGSPDKEKAFAAFQAGVRKLNAPNVSFPFVPWEQCVPQRMDAALDKCAGALPAIRERLLNACVQAVAADGVVKPPEAELLRAISDNLGCPLPPFIEVRAG